jgi:hypothetical protein
VFLIVRTFRKNTMDCEKDTFSIFYDNRRIEVDPFCLDKDMKFRVHLPKGDVLLEMEWDKENQMEHWCEVGKGETELATQLGELIECCPDHK